MVRLSLSCHRFGGGAVPVVAVHTLLSHPHERLGLCIKQFRNWTAFGLRPLLLGAMPHFMVGCTNQCLKHNRLQSCWEPRLEQPSSLASGRKHHFFVSPARGFKQGEQARLSYCCGTRGAGEGENPMTGAQDRPNIKNLVLLGSLEKEDA